MKLYHGTPYEFNLLRKGSWLATHQEEAVTHLLMKNSSLSKPDILIGWIICFEFEDEINHPIKFKFRSHLGGAAHYQTTCDIPVDESLRFPLRDILPGLSHPFNQFKNITSVMDLKPLLEK